jgi:hypothetical protein
MSVPQNPGRKDLIMRAIGLAIFFGTLAVYLAMILWTLPAIQADAGGLRAFDLRPGGYDLIEAQAFLSALGAEGRALYLGAQHWLDLVYPALLAMFLGLLIWRLGADAPRWVLWIGAALCVAGAGFDYLENARVAAMLVSPVDQIDAGQVAAASFATVWKSRLTTLAVVLLLGLAIRAGWRKWKGLRA